MDGLAHHRKNQGLVATSINWGPWSDVGMAASDVVLQRLMKDGWQPMNASQGCDFIGYLLKYVNYHKLQFYQLIGGSLLLASQELLIGIY